MRNRPTIWRALFETQWKSARSVLVLGTVAVFALPLLSFRTALGTRNEALFVMSMQAWSIGYTLAAAGLGLMVGMLAWSNDHRLRHIYALTLPLPRWQYALNRFTAGLLMLALPVATLFVAAEIVAHSALVPPALTAYPIALTLRFAFATLVAYAIFFAISSATGRTAAYILAGIGLIFAGQFLAAAIGAKLNLINYVIDVVFATPGLLAVFSGRWMLIDV